MTIRILLADDHPLTRAGLAAWAAGEPELELVAEASDGEEAWRAIAEARPDVALMDIEMPNGSGIDVAARVSRERLPVRVVMLTAYRAVPYVLASLRAGAAGFVLKTAPFETIKEAVVAAASGRFYLDSSLSLADAGEPDAEPLTEREREVLLSAARGMTASQTAAELSITERTVGAHLASIYGKLGARGKTDAVLAALKRGMIFLDDIKL